MATGWETHTTTEQTF